MVTTTFTKDTDVYASEYNKFIKQYPQYAETGHLDECRKSDFKRLDDKKHIYVDFVGSNLYPESLIKQHQDFLLNNVYGNPHSVNPTSSLATEHCEDARYYVKEYFNDKDDEYVVVFTQNASGALKLVGESYPFTKDCRYILTADNHNSVNGIREFARNAGAEFSYTPITEDGLQIKGQELASILEETNCSGNKLFAFPAQSNFSGVKHDLNWIKKAQDCGWDVLLDAAAYVPTNILDLTQHKPEFVTVSFYKVFGYPTGIGCLLIRKSVIDKLKRPWFAGGTIQIATVCGDDHIFSDGEAGFEDGTINFLNIPAVKNGLQFMKNLGMDNIQKRTSALTEWTLRQLLSLKHDNGKNVVKVLGTTNLNERGATLTLNVYDTDGKMYLYEVVEEDANKVNISLRAGCFCNPGADEAVSNLTPEDMKPIFSSGKKLTEEAIEELIKHKVNRGAVRASFGYISNFNDAYQFVNFIKGYVNK